MNDQESAFVHTFSHQPLPAAGAEAAPSQALAPTAASYAPLRDAVAAAASAMAPTFVDGAENVVADRLRSLRHVREQLPSNTLVPRAELAARVPAKLRPLVDAWDWTSGNLVVLGPTRIGKTSGVALLVRSLLERSARSHELFDTQTRKFWGGCGSELALADLVRWQSCRDLTTAVREFPLGHGAPEVIQRCQHARLLVLEDLGATDDKATLERILNVRYERRWPTITTAGLRSTELVSTFGEALVRRLSERAGQPGTIVNLFPSGTKS